jgi:hypothetical protein
VLDATVGYRTVTGIRASLRNAIHSQAVFGAARQDLQATMPDYIQRVLDYFQAEYEDASCR